MKRYLSSLAAMMLVAVLSLQLSAPALAVSAFADVAPDAPYQESLEYLAAHEIVNGTGDDRFAPDAPVTVRQWAAMLCRAYGLESHDAFSAEFGIDAVQKCLKHGWLQITALSDPDTRMCWPALLQSAFRAIGLPVYSYELYPGGTQLSPQENILRIGKELGLCGQDTTLTQLVTRGEAAVLLHQILTQTFEVTPPPTPILIQNNESLSLDRYLLELDHVPQPILLAFQDLGWTYTVDFDCVKEYSVRLGIPCSAVTSYSERQIYISDPGATLHEMGHFLHRVTAFPSEFEKIFETESPAAASLLRDYALTDAHEYFADCFDFWITYRNNDRQMTRFREILPETYRFFSELEASGWGYADLMRRG